jgi:hypothetical protein
VTERLKAWTPWLTFMAGAVLAYLLSGAGNVARLQQQVDAAEQKTARQDSAMTQITENFCRARVDVDTYHLIALRDWRNEIEKEAMQPPPWWR